MNLIVEDGTGVFKANSYVGLAFAMSYLVQRNKSTEWTAASVAAQRAALIEATDYIDKRFGLKFLGQILFTEMAVPATGMLMVIGAPQEDETIRVGSETYVFKISASGPNEITIGGSPAITAENIAEALDSRLDILIYRETGSALITIEAVDPGPIEFDTISTSENVVFDTDNLIGGSLSGQQPLCFPRTSFEGIPETLKMATVEYAVRALAEPLMPDPVMDESGQQVRRRSEKVGPVEEEIVFQSSPGEIFKTYPEADRLIKPLITDFGGTYR